MKVKVLTILIISITNYLFSQPYFFNTTEELVINQGQILTLHNNGIVVNSYSYDEASDSFYSKLYLLNESGKVVLEKNLNHTVSSIIELTPDTLLMLYVSRNKEENYLNLALIDNMLNIIPTDSILIQYKNLRERKLKVLNNQVLFYSNVFNSSGFDLTTIIGYITNEGKFLHDTTEIHDNELRLFDIIQDSEYNYYLLYAFNKIIKIDSAFNYISEYKLKFDDLVMDYNATFTGNGNIIISGSTIDYQMAIIKADDKLRELNTYNIESNYPQNTPGIYSSLIPADSCFYFVGTKNSYTENFPNINSYSSIFLLKMNYDFDVIWEKEFGGDAFYVTMDICRNNKGGCFVLSSRYKFDTLPEQKELVILNINDDGIICSTPLRSLNPIGNYTHVFPNPGNDIMNINTNLNSNSTIHIFSSLGLQVFEGVISSQTLSVNADNWAAGLYTYIIISEHREIECGKWVKQ